VSTLALLTEAERDELLRALRDCIQLVRAADSRLFDKGTACDLLIFKDAEALVAKYTTTTGPA
jgi:hypothetical protein